MTDQSIRVEGFSYRRKVLDVVQSPPVIVAISPDRPELWQWGVFQFPRIWRGSDTGALYLQIHNGLDTQGRTGFQEPALYYESCDDGATWRSVGEDAVDFAAPTLRLSNGEEVRIGDFHGDVQQAETLIPSTLSSAIDLEALGISAVGERESPNKHGLWGMFAYGDIPEHERCFRIQRRSSSGGVWQEETGIIDFPELVVASIIKSRVYDTWHDVYPRINRPWPKQVAVHPSGELFSVVGGLRPEIERYFTAVYCIASSDGGRTWRYRGTVADQPDRSAWGFSATESALICCEDQLVCVMRTDKATTKPADTRTLMLSRSEDGGATWSRPDAIAPYSVRPQLVQLDNGVVAAVYGRPGLHMIFSNDRCRRWHSPVTVIGRHESESRRIAAITGAESLYPVFMHNDTCANSGHVLLDQDSFLIVYSDFNTFDAQGTRRKAIKVRRITVWK